MIELRFVDSGADYQAVKAVADRLGISVRDYLLKCLDEGHRVLALRAAVQLDDLDIPAFERRSSMVFDPEELEEKLRNLRMPIKPSNKRDRENG